MPPTGYLPSDGTGWWAALEHGTKRWTRQRGHVAVPDNRRYFVPDGSYFFTLVSYYGGQERKGNASASRRKHRETVPTLCVFAFEARRRCGQEWWNEHRAEPQRTRPAVQFRSNSGVSGGWLVPLMLSVSLVPRSH